MIPLVAVLAALHFIVVHASDGQETEINIDQISTIRKPQDQAVDKDHFAKGTQCIIIMANGKFIATMESCAEIIKAIAAAEKSGGLK